MILVFNSDFLRLGILRYGCWLVASVPSSLSCSATAAWRAPNFFILLAFAERILAILFFETLCVSYCVFCLIVGPSGSSCDGGFHGGSTLIWCVSYLNFSKTHRYWTVAGSLVDCGLGGWGAYQFPCLWACCCLFKVTPRSFWFCLY